MTPNTQFTSLILSVCAWLLILLVVVLLLLLYFYILSFLLAAFCSEGYLFSLSLFLLYENISVCCCAPCDSVTTIWQWMRFNENNKNNKCFAFAGERRWKLHRITLVSCCCCCYCFCCCFCCCETAVARPLKCENKIRIVSKPMLATQSRLPSAKRIVNSVLFFVLTVWCWWFFFLSLSTFLFIE